MTDLDMLACCHQKKTSSTENNNFNNASGVKVLGKNLLIKTQRQLHKCIYLELSHCPGAPLRLMLATHHI